MFKKITGLFILVVSFFGDGSIAYAQSLISQDSSIKYESDAQVLNVPCNVGTNVCLGSMQLGLPVYFVSASRCSTSFDSNGDCVGGTTPTVGYSQSPSSLEAWYLTNMTSIDNAKGRANLIAPASFSIADTKCAADYSSCDMYYNSTDSNGTPYYKFYGNFGIYVYSSVSGCPNSGVYVNGKGCIIPNSSVSDRTNPKTNCDCDKPSLGLSDGFNGLFGNPIDALSGQKVEQREDLSFPMSVKRYYSSGNSQFGMFGGGWRTQYDHYFNIFNSNPNLPATIDIIEPNGVELLFGVNSTGGFTPLYSEHSLYSLVFNNQNNYVLTFPNGKQEIYNLYGQILSETMPNGSYVNYMYSGGLLVQVTDNFNHWLQFTYSNVANAVIQISASNGDILQYNYSGGMVVSVVFNSIETVSYQYSGQYLTGKADENNTIYASFDYATSNGVTSASSNQLLLNSNSIWKYSFNYDSNNQQNTVTQSNGFNEAISYTQINGVKKATNINLNGYHASYSYDSNGNLTRYNDYNGGSTFYNYDGLNRLTSKTLPNGKSISIVWSSGTNVPQTISESSANGTRTTTYTYDNFLNVASKTVSGAGGSMVWSYSWTADGRLLGVSNPDGSGYSYTYYGIDSSPRSGLLNSVTNALGQTITINSYDNRGNATSITGIDGNTKIISYDMRGRVLNESVGNITNRYSYDMVGNLLSVQYANGYALSMNYDGIHRLVSIADNMGGSESIFYDSVTNKVTNQNMYQGSNLVLARNDVLDSLGRTVRTWKGTTRTSQNINYSSFIDMPNSVSDANGTNTSYYEDGVGNITSKNSPDNSGSYNYDMDNNLTSANINSQTTTYTYDDFGRVTQLSSPDSGNHTVTYNTGSRVSVHTDANGTNHTQSYDVGGNLVSVSHVNGSTTVNENFTYDMANRLIQMADSSGTTAYSYNSLGLVTNKTQVANGKSFGVQYSYDSVGELSGMTYPSGLTVNYSKNNGFLTGINVSGFQVVSNISYNSVSKQPISWMLSGGQVNVNYTADGLITGFSDGLLNQSLTTDNENNILSVADNQGTNISAGYTTSYGLNSFVSSNENLTYAYYSNLNLEAVNGGNPRLFFNMAQTANKPQNVQTTDTFYYRYDANGNTLNDDFGNYTYDLKNNMVSSTRVMYGSRLTGNYVFNGLNQRVAKSVNNVITYFVYNENSQLIGEYDGNGNAIAEYVYFGLRPVAVRTNGQTYIVHTDYLSTPRIVTSSGGNVVWQWNNTDAFGNSPANGSIVFNLRFAGQYYDYESGLHYNMNRVYNPEVGRYM